MAQKAIFLLGAQSESSWFSHPQIKSIFWEMNLLCIFVYPTVLTARPVQLREFHIWHRIVGSGGVWRWEKKLWHMENSWKTADIGCGEESWITRVVLK